jgi:hypothetical protein
VFQLYISGLASPTVSITEIVSILPAQIDAAEALRLKVGVLLTVTVCVAEEAIHPFPSVTVTLYAPPVVTLSVCVSVPSLQVKLYPEPEPPVAVAFNVSMFPAHTT